MLAAARAVLGSVEMDAESGKRPAAGARAMRQLAYLQQMRERHGDVFPLRTLGEQLLVVGDPELARQVFHAPTDVLRAGEGNRRVLGWLLGEHSLILLDGERHMSHRRMLLPPLHGRRLERHAATIRALAEEQLAGWPRGEEVAMLPRVRALTLDVVLCALFGHAEDLGALRAALLELLSPVEAGSVEARIPAEPIARAEALVGDQVAARRADARIEQRDDVLSLLLGARYEDGSPLSDAELRDELMTLIFAGTETTAASLAWALERLARAPRALARAAGEASAKSGPYIDAVIQETLRMRPAVPMAARLAARPFQLAEHSIAPGTVIAVSALLIHHRADLYPEPMAFRPERFLDRPPGTYTWIPFGGGVRRCIGGSFALLEMRIVLSALLSQMVPRVAAPAPEGLLGRGNTLVPARGARIVLEPS